MINECDVMNTTKMELLDVASFLWDLHCSKNTKSFYLQARMICGCSVVSLYCINVHGHTTPVMINAIWAKKIASIFNCHNHTYLNNIISHVHLVIMSTGAYQIKFK